jgi:hypothetical protein
MARHKLTDAQYEALLRLRDAGGAVVDGHGIA